MAKEALCFLCCGKKTKEKHSSKQVRVVGVASEKAASEKAMAPACSDQFPPLSFSASGGLGVSASSDPEDSDHSHSDAEATGGGLCSCGNTLLADAAFCRKCGKKKSPKTSGDREKELKVLEELEGMAAKLEGNMQKFPKGGKKMFSFGGGPQMRFFAVMPASYTTEAKKTDFQKWKGGILGYWENHAAFTKKEAPKGYVNLLYIVKVDHLPNEHDSKGVVVKHKEGETKQELVLIASTENAAKEWSFLMYEFLSKLRSHDG